MLGAALRLRGVVDGRASRDAEAWSSETRLNRLRQLGLKGHSDDDLLSSLDVGRYVHQARLLRGASDCLRREITWQSREVTWR